MIANSTVSLWMKRAEQARRIADTLQPRDRELLCAYARECEVQAHRFDRWDRRAA